MVGVLQLTTEDILSIVLSMGGMYKQDPNPVCMKGCATYCCCALVQ